MSDIGAKYDPNFNLKYPNTNNYSFGYRRSNKIINQSTKNNLGPGKYDININLTSKYQDNKGSRFTKNNRFNNNYNNNTTHESYYLYSSLNKQIDSKKVTEKNPIFLKQNRNKKAGFLPDLQIESIKNKVTIKIPKF